MMGQALQGTGFFPRTKGAAEGLPPLYTMTFLTDAPFGSTG